MLTDAECADLEKRWLKAYEPSYFEPNGDVKATIEHFDGQAWFNNNVAPGDRDRFMEWRKNNIMRRRRPIPPPDAAEYLKQINDTIFMDD
jgi:hypothetical protein